MTIERRSLAGKVMAGIGVAVLLSEVVLHIMSWYLRRDYELNHVVLVIGVLIGFAGFWTIDSKKTKDGVDTVRDLVPRFGNRSTDAIAVPGVETKTTAIPVEEKKDD